MKAGIRIKIMGALFLIALLTFSVTLYYSLSGMRRFMNSAIQYGEQIGRQFTGDLREAVLKRASDDLKRSAADQAYIISQLTDTGSSPEKAVQQVASMRKNESVLLVTADGKFIAGQDAWQQTPGSTDFPAQLREALRQQTGILRLDNGRKNYLTASAAIPGHDWKVMVFRSEGLVMKDVIRMENLLENERKAGADFLDDYISGTIPFYVGISLVILILILLLGYLLAKQLTRPIFTLMRRAKIMGDGHLERKIHLHTGDELEQLADSFNRMADDLTQYIRSRDEAVRDRQRVESELKAAAEIQTAMLPGKFPAFPDRSDIDVRAVMKPAREVGGDLYDFLLIDPHHLFFVIGDVAGKGMPAALFMATAKTLMRGFAKNQLSPAAIFHRTNNYLADENDACMFITAFCGILDTRTGDVVCCNAGHNPPIRLATDGNCTYLRPPAGFPLGPFPQEKEGFYTEIRFRLTPGETLVLYTDGVTEALDEQKNQFGEGRLTLALSAAPPAVSPLKDTLNETLKILHGFTGNAPQSDDITILMVQYRKASADSSAD